MKSILYLVGKIRKPMLYLLITIGLAGLIYGSFTQALGIAYIGLGIFVLAILGGAIYQRRILPLFYRAAVTEYENRKIDNAVQLINLYIDACPENYYAYVLRSYFYLCKKQLSQAKEDAQYAIQLDPKYSGGHFALGQWFAFQGFYEEAVEYLSKAIHLNPNNSLAQCFVGITFYRLKRYDKAIEHFEKAISMDGTITCKLSSHYYLGRSLEAIGQYERAKEIFGELEKFSEGVSKWEEEASIFPSEYPIVIQGQQDLADLKQLLLDYKGS